MSPMVLSDKFLDGLIEVGIVPPNARHVIIEAKWGEPVQMYFSTIELDEDKLRVVAEAAFQARVEGQNV